MQTAVLDTSITGHQLLQRKSYSPQEHLRTGLQPSNIFDAFADSRKKLILALSCMPVSLHVRVKQLVSQRTDFCDILYWEILLQFCRENSNRVNIGQKYQALYVWFWVVTGTNTVRCKYSQHWYRQREFIA